MFFQTSAFHKATYGCESWAMTSDDRKLVDAFDLWCYQRLRMVSRVERKTNKRVFDKIGYVLKLRKRMTDRKTRFVEHSIRQRVLKNDLTADIERWREEITLEPIAKPNWGENEREREREREIERDRERDRER